MEHILIRGGSTIFLGGGGGGGQVHKLCNVICHKAWGLGPA